jgi:DnaJ-class molecular chaperone
MDFKDYYKTLGIKKDSDEKEVKDAFKKLAKKLHPDAEGGSEEKFKEINEAYEVLKDQSKRSRYDYLYSNMNNTSNAFSGNKSQNFKQQKMYSNYGSFADFYKQKEQELREQTTTAKASAQANPSNPKKDESFSDFFEMFFGKQKEKATNPEKETPKSKPMRGEDFEMEIELSLEDAYHGCIRKIEITNTGKQVRRLEVSIPSGVRSGTKIKVTNEGKAGLNGGANGDLYLIVKLKEHDKFWIDGDDVHSEITIEPQEAVLGCIKKITTLEDIVELVIPANTNNGRILRLREKGLKNSHGEVLGDHYVHISIDIPKKLTNEEITTYKYLRELADRR